MPSAPQGSQKHYNDGGTTDVNPGGVEHGSASALDKGTSAATTGSTARPNNEDDPETRKVESWGSRGEGNKPAEARHRKTQKKSNSSTSPGGNVSQSTVTQGQTSEGQTPQPAQGQAPQATEGQNPPVDAQKKGRARATTSSSTTTAGP